jgi:flagellar basal body-associated protein FliL
MMADKAEKKGEAPAAPAGGAPAAGHSEKEAKGGLLGKTPVLLAIVMVVEAVVLIAGYWVVGGHPKQASAAELVADEKGDGKGAGKGKAGDKKTIELPVLDAKAPNHTNGRTYLYDVSIFVVVKADDEQRVKDALKDNKALIEDRLSTIVRESDPDKLGGGSEPGLETLRRQVKYQLDRIVGEGVIEEVLVPRCIPFRTDY